MRINANKLPIKVNNSLTRVFTFMLCFLCGSMLFAQKNYTTGYVVTLSNDTIHGKIKDAFIRKTYVKLMDDQGEEVKYKAKEILGYSKGGVKHYLSIYNKGFATIIVNGQIKLMSKHYSGSHTHSATGYSGNNKRLCSGIIQLK